MANLLKDSAIQVKMLEILGFAPTTLWTDIAWERLCELVGYDLSESEVKEVFQGGIDDKILYLGKRPVTEITKITFNNIEQASNSYGIYKERAVNFSRIFSFGIFFNLIFIILTATTGTFRCFFLVSFMLIIKLSCTPGIFSFFV